MLKGSKIILRPMKQEDVERQHEFNQDIELYGLDSDVPHLALPEDAQAFYERRTKSDSPAVTFAIEADGKYIGFCSLYGLQNPHGNLELGITIGDRDYWGRGYGRESVNLLLEYGFHYLGGRRIILTTNVKNQRAIRCYLACGFIEEGRPRKAVWIEGEYTDLINMSILRDEWQALNKKIVSSDQRSAE